MNMYQQLGGAEALDALVCRFYDLMDLEEQYAALRSTHSESLDYARDRLYKFLSGWLGGEPLYEQQYGHPRLRQRHMPFAVNMQTRNEWIACFAQALSELDVAKEWAEPVLVSLFALADWMRNQNEAAYPPPQPPMSADPIALQIELGRLLKQYGISGYFAEHAV